jgi:hypothetical protein
VLVSRESSDRYTVRQLPAAAQLKASSRDGGVQVARGFASKYAVNLWYTEDGGFRLLEAYRAARAPRAGDRAARTA